MISSRLSPKTKSLIKELIETTKSTNNEHGFVLCSNGYIEPSNETCVGNECSVKIEGTCNENLNRIGYFHTHPVFKLLKEKYQKDELNELITFDEFLEYTECIMPSKKDIYHELQMVHKKQSKGNICIASDCDNTIMYCYSLKPSITTQKIPHILKYHKFDIKTSKSLVNMFDKEIVNL